ncbi:MAG TPA: diguanylate cyclase [Thermoanaerobaculia bacterium]|nr:diguanylate cyclase [Thermoanaerobaculia bacterium]
MQNSPLVIVIIDDSSPIRSLLEASAAVSGELVVAAGTFAEGLIVLREYPWDVAIIDPQLPDGDGLALCRDVAAGLREVEPHRHILFLSATDSPEGKLRGFDAGADEYISKNADAAELVARFGALRRSVISQKDLLLRLATLEHLSVIDGLTQVYNRRFFQSELRMLFDVASRHDRPLAIAMIDIDHFKEVNDANGHAIGDLVLSQVSTAIAQKIRSCDILARYGGDEFAVLLPEATLADAAVIAERVRSAVESLRVDGNSAQLRMSISVGVAAVPKADTPTHVHFLEAADRALYRAKEQGRNRVRLDGTEASPRDGASSGLSCLVR